MQRFALEVLDKAPYIAVSFTGGWHTYGVPLSLARTDEKVLFPLCHEGDKLDCTSAQQIRQWLQ